MGVFSLLDFPCHENSVPSCAAYGGAVWTFSLLRAYRRPKPIDLREAPVSVNVVVVMSSNDEYVRL